MGKLICAGITSLDGYIADKDGDFDWSAPGDEVHAFVNDLLRPVGVHLYGRRMYEVMVFWETAEALPSANPVTLDFANVWQAADKIVYSTSLESASTARTRIERRFDPGAVRRLKASTDRDISIGGPTLAAHAIRAGLVDEFHLFVNPIAVGGGLAFFPDDARVELKLLEERRFGNGVVYLRYAAA